MTHTITFEYDAEYSYLNAEDGTGWEGYRSTENPQEGVAIILTQWIRRNLADEINSYGRQFLGGEINPRSGALLSGPMDGYCALLSVSKWQNVSHLPATEWTVELGEFIVGDIVCALLGEMGYDVEIGEMVDNAATVTITRR